MTDSSTNIPAQPSKGASFDDIAASIIADKPAPAPARAKGTKSGSNAGASAAPAPKDRGVRPAREAANGESVPQKANSQRGQQADIYGDAHDDDDLEPIGAVTGDDDEDQGDQLDTEDTILDEGEDEDLHSEDASEDEGDDQELDLDATDDSPADEGDDDDLRRSLGDDHLVSVTVDGRDEEVSIGELRKRYAGGVAIERRLQEATEARQGARETHNNVRKVAEVALKALAGSMFQRLIPPPDEKLRMSNPQEYLLQRDDYEREGQMLNQRRGQLAQAIQQVDEANNILTAQEREAARHAVREALPVLKDKVKGPIRRKAIIDVALSVGFTEADISSAMHPGLFKLADLAADGLRYRNAQRQVKVNPVAQKRKPLAGSAGKVSKTTSIQRQQAAANTKARQTGSTDDVAATMIVPAKRRPR